MKKREFLKNILGAGLAGLVISPEIFPATPKIKWLSYDQWVDKHILYSESIENSFLENNISPSLCFPNIRNFNKFLSELITAGGYKVDYAL